MLLLLIDDDPDDRFLFAEALKEAAPSVICQSVANGVEAVKQMGLICPEVIFCDVNMPTMSGYEFFEEVKMQLNNKRFIMMFTNRMEEGKCSLMHVEFMCKQESFAMLVNELRILLND